MTEDAIGKQIADIAVEIHQEVGPGLLKTVYEVDRRPGYLLNFSEVPMKPGSPASLSGWKRIVDSLAFLARGNFFSLHPRIPLTSRPVFHPYT